VEPGSGGPRAEVAPSEAPYRASATSLDNGLSVVSVSMPHLHSAGVSLFVRVGSRHETTATNGLSHFLEHMFFRGCEGYKDSTALNAAMEDLGGTLDGYTMRDYSAYHATIHPDFVEQAAAIFGAMFRAPSFQDIEIERSIILEEILDALDERGRVIDLDTIAHREAFSGHPLAQSIDGPRKNLRRFTIDDLTEHRRHFYGAKNMVLCFAGAIDPKRCLAAARTSFGRLFSGRRAVEALPGPPPGAPRFVYVRSDDTQTRARLSFRVVADVHPDFPALLLIRRILDGGLSGRLQVELVEKRGIAYDVGADLESYADCGLFDFEFAVAHKKLTYALEELAQVIVRITRDGIPQDELDRVRRRARIGLEFGLDSPYELSNWFGATQLFHEPMPPEVRMAQLDAVTPADIQAVARRYFTGAALTVAAVGGADTPTVRDARRAIKGFVEAL
jgi:predicted Zn-dependent peptidase